MGRKILFLIIDKAISVFLQFLVLIVFARQLGPEDIGVVGILFVFVTMSEVLITGGLGNSIIQKANLEKSTLSTAFIANSALGLFFYICLVVFSHELIVIFDIPEYPYLLQSIYLIIFINSLSVVPNAIVLKRLDFKSKAISNSTSIVFSSIIGIVTCYQGYGIYSFAIMHVTKSLVSLYSIFYFSKWKPTFEFEVNELKTLYSFSWKLILASYISFVNDNVYILAIGNKYTLLEVGFYNQAKKISDVMNGSVTSIINTVVFPYLSKHKRESKTDFLFIIKLLGLIVYPFTILISYYSQEIIEVVLGEQWLDSSPILKIFCFSLMFIPISVANINLLNSEGRSDLFLRADLLKFLLNLINVIVFYAFDVGIINVVVGILTIRISAMFINMYFVFKLKDISIYEQLSSLKLGFLSALIVFFIARFIEVLSLPFYVEMVFVMLTLLMYIGFKLKVLRREYAEKISEGSPE